MSDRNEVMVTKLKLPAKLIQGISMEAKSVLPKNLLINLLIVSRFDERQMRSTGLKIQNLGPVQKSKIFLPFESGMMKAILTSIC